MRTVFIGHFGSGKTEVAIGYAFKLVAEGHAPRLLDLDVVTPYYRSREVKQQLAALGVEVVTPPDDISLSDLPLIAYQALAALRDESRPAILDIGGDEGAQVMRTIGEYIDPATCTVYGVANPCRPMTNTAAKICDMVRWLQAVSGLKVSGLVNNANLGRQTQAATVLEGLEIVSEAAAKLEVPVAFTAAREEIAADLGLENVLPLKLYMRFPWEAQV